MPIGPYENFAACVAAQKRKGHSDEAAKKICGEIEKRAKGEITPTELTYNLTEIWVKEQVFPKHEN